MGEIYLKRVKVDEMALVMSNCLKISELAERWLLIGIPNFERLGLGNEFGYFCNAPD